MLKEGGWFEEAARATIEARGARGREVELAIEQEVARLSSMFKLIGHNVYVALLAFMSVLTLS